VQYQIFKFNLFRLMNRFIKQTINMSQLCSLAAVKFSILVRLKCFSHVDAWV
jgi:hypothetical protein